MVVTTPTQNRGCLPNLKTIESSIPICHICSCDVVDNEAHFVLECPPYDSLRDGFLSLFENAVQVVLSLSTNWIIVLILAVISQKNVHSATLRK